MLNDYLVKQGKHCLFHSKNQNFIYDILLPNGIGNMTGKAAVEIKIFRNIYKSQNIIYDTMARILMEGEEFETLLFIIVNEIPEAIRKKIKEKEKKLNFELLIWDIDNLIDIFKSNEELFVETYNNLNTVLLVVGLLERMRCIWKNGKNISSNYMKTMKMIILCCFLEQVHLKMLK